MHQWISNQKLYTYDFNWAEQARLSLLESLSDIPGPSRLDESWRFGSPKNYSLEGFTLASGADDDHIMKLAKEKQAMQGDKVLRVICANGEFHYNDEGAKDLVICSTAQFCETYPELAKKYFPKAIPTIGSDQLATLASAIHPFGVVIWAKKDVSAHIEIQHFLNGDHIVCFPYTLVIAEKNSSLHILEQHIGSSSDVSQMCVGIQQVQASGGASVHIALVQNLSDDSRAVELAHLSATEYSLIEHFTTHKGTKWTRQETIASTDAEEANIRLYSANRLTNHQQLEQRTYQHHTHRGTASNLYYANVLNDHAAAVFSGMIRIDEGAHDSNAYQSNKNLLLSPNAVAHSLPGLEILADRVQCSHGTATSSISPEEVFYLSSRGIPEVTAKKMISDGVLQNVIEQFDSSPLKEALTSIIL